MATSKLVLDYFEIDAFYLCAIHANMPSYKMAFLLNKYLDLKFSRAITDVEVYNNNTSEIYSRYVYEDQINYTTFTLVKNKCVLDQQQSIISADLFAAENSRQVIKNLIPQHKNVDYFLKIETDEENYPLKPLLLKIIKISQVITAFSVDYEQIKSKTNLIFE